MYAFYFVDLINSASSKGPFQLKSIQGDGLL